MAMRMETCEQEVFGRSLDGSSPRHRHGKIPISADVRPSKSGSVVSPNQERLGASLM